VTVGEKKALERRSLVARQINLLEPSLTQRGTPVRCSARIRYNHAPQPAEATVTGEDELTVRFDEPQTAVTPGQAVVVYDGDVVLGGGWIESAAS
jgi:tRNA-specific 2-thiouridylase